jgi:AraC-like DNA-binding protein
MTVRIKSMTPGIVVEARLSNGTPVEPTVAAGVARGLLRFVVAKGANESALAERAGIVPADLQDPDARIRLSSYVALMRAGQALCGDPALALHYAEEVDLSEISVVGLVTLACETMQDALDQLNRYNRLVAEPARPVTADRFQHWPAGPGELWLVDTAVGPPGFPEFTEATLARLACGPRRFDETPFVRAVHVTYAAPSYRDEYERIFRAPIVFESDKNALLIDASWRTHPIAPKQRYAFGILNAHAEALLRNLEQTESMRGRVERLLMPVLHTQETGMDAIATRLGMSRATLHRQLKAEGITYESVLDELRHTMAQHYLDGRKVSVQETAYLVGFSDPAAFSRAFKRWTGKSPGQRNG